MKFSSTSNTSESRCLNPLFQNQRPHVLLPLLSGSTKWQTNIVLIYHPILSGLPARIHLIFPQLFIAFSLPRIFVEFSLKPVYPTMVGKVFNFIVFRLLEDAFITQKIASRILYSCPPGKVLSQVPIITHQAEGNYSSQAEFFLKSLFPQQKKWGRGNYV